MSLTKKYEGGYGKIDPPKDRSLEPSQIKYTLRLQSIRQQTCLDRKR